VQREVEPTPVVEGVGEPFAGWEAEADWGAEETAAVTSETVSAAASVQRAVEWETMAAPEGEGDEGVQAMPLQAAWPVEAVAQPTPYRSAAEGSRPPLVQRRSAEELASDDNVRSILETVTAGQKSDSSIELVLPRRPRPAPVSTGVAAPRPAAEPVGAAPLAQRMPLPEVETAEQPAPTFAPLQPFEAQGEAAEGVVGGPAAPTYQPVPAPVTAVPLPVQREVEAPAGPAPATPHMVPTEIGDLPSDLWQLLGTTPPAPVANAPTGNGSAVQRQVTAAPRPAAPMTAAAMAGGSLIAAPVVQRAETAATQTAAPPTATPAPAATEAAEGEGEGEKKSEVDIDELSRQVMQVLRRRLAVEWERSRGRF
jgi:hypothetical protein